MCPARAVAVQLEAELAADLEHAGAHGADELDVLVPAEELSQVLGKHVDSSFGAVDAVVADDEAQQPHEGRHARRFS